MNKKIRSYAYAGIGSRTTPQGILETCFMIGNNLAIEGLTLRSGGAPGANTWFEKGVDSARKYALEWHPELSQPIMKEIYIPWNGFNGRTDAELGVYSEIAPEAFEIAKKYHPYWDNLSEGAKKLQARNSYQVLGDPFDNSVDFIVCWTPEGKITGGTGQALRIAKDLNIKVFNLALYERSEDAYPEIINYIKTLC